ncbi:RNA polymerase ECF sigma factor [[Actinomadura] parvosata subsp. kistnae]|nr:RNA polymerase ECF sigma factor [Actinomadura parvosata subsp. kistnae]
MRLCGAWPRVKRKDSPHGYARITMARLHISIWRRRRREQLTGEPPEGVHHEIFPPDEEQGLWEALAVLPRRQRAVLVLRYYEQLSDAEIAKGLGISAGTVRSQAFRDLDKLRSALSSAPATHGSM